MDLRLSRRLRLLQRRPHLRLVPAQQPVQLERRGVLRPADRPADRRGPWPSRRRTPTPPADSGSASTGRPSTRRRGCRSSTRRWSTSSRSASATTSTAPQAWDADRPTLGALTRPTASRSPRARPTGGEGQREPLTELSRRKRRETRGHLRMQRAARSTPYAAGCSIWQPIRGEKNSPRVLYDKGAAGAASRPNARSRCGVGAVAGVAGSGGRRLRAAGSTGRSSNFDMFDPLPIEWPSKRAFRKFAGSG